MPGFHWAALLVWLGLAAGLDASSEESRKRQASIEADTGLHEELQYRATARSAGTDTWHSYDAELLKVADHYAPPAYQLQQAETAQSVIAHRVHNMMANLHRMRAERRAKMEAAADAFKESQDALREAKQAEQDVAEADKALTEVEEETKEAVVDTREVRDDLQEMSSEQTDAKKHMEKAEKLVEDDPDAGKVYAPAPTPTAAGEEDSESKVADGEQADSDSSGVKGVHVAVKERGRVKSHSVGEYQEKTPESEGTTGWLWSSWTALGPLWLRKLMGCVIFGALLCGCCVGCFACWRMESSYKKANELNTAASGVIARQHAQQRAMERGDARYRSHSRGEDVSLSSTPRGGASASGRSYRSAPLQGPPSQGPSSRPASVPPSPALVFRGSSTPVYPAAGRPIQPTHSYGGSSAPLQATHSYSGSSAEGPRVSSRGGGCKSPTPVAG
mmetsp:Transcript_7347/g.13013  ORF Transcript_7347/g.13013 Transcript_7347/m.13013 type:complete len:446 (+) Transcript_7347:72-1409(+)